MPATHTPNLNLNKPDRQDLVSVVTDINDNMDTLDGAIGALPSGHTVQGQINTLKPVSIVLNPVTNANGETTVVTQDSRINEGLKAVYIEVGTPETFLAPIRITTGEGQIELYCANAVGSSTVTVVVEMATVTDSADPQPASVTSTEFDILANRIGTLSQLTTTQKTNVVGAINEINGNLANQLVYKINKEYTNVALGSSGWVQIEDMDSLLSGNYAFLRNWSLVSIIIEGFYNSELYNIVRGSTIRFIYAIGAKSTTVQYVKVTYVFVNTTETRVTL